MASTVPLKPLDQFVQNNAFQFIVDDRFVDDIQFNFNILSDRTESNTNASFVTLEGTDSEASVSSVIEDVFEFAPESFTVSFEDVIPGAVITFPSGIYLKEESVPQFTIDKIVDSQFFVKMTSTERDFLNQLIDAGDIETFGNFGISSLKIQIENNAPLNQIIRLTSGRTISISQILGQDNIPEIRFESSIPLQYFHINNYSVTPVKPDPVNPYRWRVRNGPYTPGTLRIFVNTHRVPEDRYDQETFASIGEFRFNSEITRDQLPGSDSDDFMQVDFDVPLFQGPEELGGGTGSWWGFIRTSTDGSILEANNPAAVLSFESGNSIVQITGDNIVSDNVGFGDIVTISVDQTEIDHNQLKNYVAAEHHLPGTDLQNIWTSINAITYFDLNDAVPTPSGSISPTSTSTPLTINGFNGIKVDVSSTVIDFSIPSDIRINRTIYSINNTYGAFTAIRLHNPSSLAQGDWVGIIADSAVSNDGLLVKLDATDLDLIRNPVGVVVDEDGTDVIVAIEGLVSITAIGLGSLIPGAVYFIDESSPGDITTVGPSVSGNFELRVGTVLDNNGTNFLMIRFQIPVIEIP
jgi:hypothetical protein